MKPVLWLVFILTVTTFSRAENAPANLNIVPRPANAKPPSRALLIAMIRASLGLTAARHSCPTLSYSHRTPPSQESNSSDDPNHFRNTPATSGGDRVDEIHKNARGMERSGNFWLSCDIKEA